MPRRNPKRKIEPASKLPSSREVTTYRALLYKPTGKLTASFDETPAFRDEFGWTAKEFRDDAGNLYERQRDGEHERWLAILERTSDDPGRQYIRIPKSGPIEPGDRLDRLDDFDWVIFLVIGLILDCEERHLFPKRPEKMRIAFRQLQKAVTELRRAYTGFYSDENEPSPEQKAE
jgi:hypothetical protein